MTRPRRVGPPPQPTRLQRQRRLVSDALRARVRAEDGRQREGSLAHLWPEDEREEPMAERDYELEQLLRERYGDAA